MKKLAVPREILLQHTIILGKTRSGKSTVMRGLVEDLLAREQPVCIVDPKGDWWGIKLAADGKGPGYPVVIFGGEHADVPIDEHAGKHVAELFATGNRPCLIDLGGWMVAARTRFWIDFASTLFRHTKGSRYLAIDEIHNFAPKGQLKGMEGNAGVMLHWTNRLASEGLGKGLQIIGASQRPQKVHNDTLTSCETLIAMRVIHPSDRGAVADWIKGSADAEGSEVLNSLADMKRGEGWVWSPEIGFGPKRVQFPMFATYDSFRPQTSADTKKLKGWAEVDLDEVRAKLASVVAEAKLNDPRELRQQLTAVRAELSKLQVHAAHLELGVGVKASKQSPAVPSARYNELRSEVARHRRALEAAMKILVKVKALDFKVETDEDRKALEQAIGAAVRQVTDPIEKRVTALAARVEGIRTAAGATEKAITALLDEKIDLTVHVERRDPFAVQRSRPTTPRPIVPRAAVAGNGNLAGAQQRILDALAELQALGIAQAERVMVAFFAGYSHLNSKGFTNALGALSSAGYLTYPRPGLVELTAEGATHARQPAVPTTAADAQERVMRMLGGATERILRPLIKAYPRELSRAALAEAAGYGHLNSKGFTNALGRLRSLGFIDYPAQGAVAAQPVLFLEQ